MFRAIYLDLLQKKAESSEYPRASECYKKWVRPQASRKGLCSMLRLLSAMNQSAISVINAVNTRLYEQPELPNDLFHTGITTTT